MEPAPGLVQADLLTVKHANDPATLFPSHAYGRGGVGHFLCTGQARVGLNRLPQAASQVGSLSVTARRRLGSCHSLGSGGDESTACSGLGGISGSFHSGFSLISTDPVSIGATRAWETGTVQHVHNFVASSRTVRPQDVPKASKWAAISYFENDPREVARHMGIMEHVQARHDESKAAERQLEQARHSMWAEQQREVFRRQRLEQAARYARSGIRPRSAYAELGALAAAEAAHSIGSGEESVGTGGGSRAASAGGITPRDPTQRFFNSEQVRAALSTPGSAALMAAQPHSQQQARSPGNSGRILRPATAGMISESGGICGLYGMRSMGGSSNNLGPALQGWVGGGGGAPPRGVIPLPKKTYVTVHERMAAEAAEMPVARVAAVAASRARAEEERMQAVVTGELQELDSFEARMRSLQRARSRAARAQARGGGSPHPDGEDDDDDDESFRE